MMMGFHVVIDVLMELCKILTITVEMQEMSMNISTCTCIKNHHINSTLHLHP